VHREVDRAYVGIDMAGDMIHLGDRVYNGQLAWTIVKGLPGGLVKVQDPEYRDPVPQVWVLADVCKVRADRTDDPHYLKAVIEQAQMMRDFWGEEGPALWDTLES